MALLPKNQRDQAMVLVTIVAVALIGLFWVYVYSPKSIEIATLQARVDTLEVRNEKAKAELAMGKVDALKAEADKYQKDLAVMQLLVPTGNEVPSLLEQVSTAARRVGLDISTVEPQPVIEGDQFDTYRYKLAVNGGYHALGAFITNVGSLTRIVAPVNLALAPRTSNTAAKPQDVMSSTLDAKFEIQTYVTKSARPSKGGKS